MSNALNANDFLNILLVNTERACSEMLADTKRMLETSRITPTVAERIYSRLSNSIEKKLDSMNRKLAKLFKHNVIKLTEHQEKEKNEEIDCIILRKHMELKLMLVNLTNRNLVLRESIKSMSEALGDLKEIELSTYSSNLLQCFREFETAAERAYSLL